MKTKEVVLYIAVFVAGFGIGYVAGINSVMNAMIGLIKDHTQIYLSIDGDFTKYPLSNLMTLLKAFR